MILAYSDESGDPGFDPVNKKASGSLLFTRASVLIDESDWFSINSAIKKFRKDLLIPPNQEFHATEIRKGQSQRSVKINGKSKKIHSKNFWGRKYPNRSDRNAFIKEYLKTVFGQFDIQIICSTIDKSKLDPKKFNPNKTEHIIKNRSLMFLTERCNEFADAKNSKILMMLDSVNAVDDFKHRKYQRDIYRTSDNISTKNFIETIVFAPSESSELLQLADVVTNTIWRHKTTGETDPFDVIKNNVFKDKIWPDSQFII